MKGGPSCRNIWEPLAAIATRTKYRRCAKKRFALKMNISITGTTKFRLTNSRLSFAPGTRDSDLSRIKINGKSDAMVFGERGKSRSGNSKKATDAIETHFNSRRRICDFSASRRFTFYRRKRRAHLAPHKKKPASAPSNFRLAREAAWFTGAISRSRFPGNSRERRVKGSFRDENGQVFGGILRSVGIPGNEEYPRRGARNKRGCEKSVREVPGAQLASSLRFRSNFRHTRRLF